MAIRPCASCKREFKTLNPFVTLCPDCRDKGKIEQTSPGEDHLPAEMSPGRTETQDRDRAQSQATQPGETELNWGTVTQGRHPQAETRDEAGDLSSETSLLVSDWQIGDVILDTYEVKQVFTSGGMGLVYRVHHHGWNIDLALKSPRPELFVRPEGAQSFVREAETWVDLGLHPQIVSCYYVRTIEGIPRIFAEYVEGGSLKDWIEDRRLYQGGEGRALERILDIAIQFAWGLHYAHEQGLVHQDVKPANLLMTPEGGAKVSDFGLAKARLAAGEVVGQVGGGSLLVSSGGYTPAYCSPEQAAQEQLSRRTDIWSWALSVLEMFTGEVVWMSGIVAASALENYLDYGAEGKGIPVMPQSLVELLRECFQDEPRARPKDMLTVADRLVDIYQQATGQVYLRQMPDAAELRADSLNNKALTMLDLGQPKKAESLLQDALQVDSLHPEATYHLALIHWRSGRIDDLEVVHRMETLRQTHSQPWPSAYLLALVHLERGDFDQALAALEEIKDKAEAQTLTKLAESLSPSAESVQVMEQRYEIPINAVAFSPDGRTVLSGGDKGALQLWDTSSGRCLRTFEGLDGAIVAVAFSPGGDYILSAGGFQISSTDSDGEESGLWLWSLETGACLRHYPDGVGDVQTVAFSPDGQRILAGRWDGSMRLWEVHSGKLLGSFIAHEGELCPVELVAFSPDGRQVYTSSETSLKRWNLDTGLCLKEIESESFTFLALSPDRRKALLYGPETFELRDLESWELLHTFPIPSDRINHAAISPDGRHFLTSTYKHLSYWDALTGICLRSFDTWEIFKDDLKIVPKGKFDLGYQRWGSVESIAFSPDGQTALTGGSHGAIRLWKLAEISIHHAPACLTTPLSSVLAIEVDQLFAQLIEKSWRSLQAGDVAIAQKLARQARSTVGFERHSSGFEIWIEFYHHCQRTSLQLSWELKSLQGEQYADAKLAFSLDGSQFINGSPGGLQVWEVASETCLQDFSISSKQRIDAVSISPDGRFALTVDDNKVQLWHIERGERLKTFEGHRDRINGVAFSPDGRLALSASGLPKGYGGMDSTVRLWDLDSGACLRIFNGFGVAVNCVAFSPDMRYALAGSEDGTLRLLDLNTGVDLHTFKGHKVHPLIKQLKDYTPKGKGHDSAVRALAFSPDGETALSGSLDRTLCLWEVRTGAALRSFEGHENYVNSVAFSPDGRYVLSGSDDQTVRLWEIQSGACVRTFEEHTGKVRAVAFSADGRMALSCALDRTLRMWALDWELLDYQTVDWDEGARSHLENFLTLHTPYAGTLPQDREPSEEEITLALTRRGKPTWTENDFQRLLHTLGCAGYGWLREEGVRKKLDELAAIRS